MHQKGNDEAIASTYYFHDIIGTLTEVRLVKCIVNFVLNSRYDGTDGMKTLDILIRHIEAKGDLGVITLRLFVFFLNLNNEDIMAELCLSSLLRQEKDNVLLLLFF